MACDGAIDSACAITWSVSPSGIGARREGQLAAAGLAATGQIVCTYFVLDKLAFAIYIGAVVEKGGKGFRQATAAAVKAQKSAVPPLFRRCFPRCFPRCYVAVIALFLTSNWYRKWLKIKSLMMLRRKFPQPRNNTIRPCRCRAGGGSRRGEGAWSGLF
jgi:hypothetical protein